MVDSGLVGTDYSWPEDAKHQRRQIALNSIRGIQWNWVSAVFGAQFLVIFLAEWVAPLQSKPPARAAQNMGGCLSG